MSLRFGTDGIRGDTRTELSAALVAALGRAGAEVLGLERFAVGRDTRASGPELSMALHHGIAAAGGSSLDLGVLPTPAVALWAAEHNVGAAMVSASHNPWHDNGVKFFAPGGLKLTDADQDQVQARFDELVADHTPEPTDVAVSDGHERARQAHVDALVNSLSGRRLDGLTVVLDTAHGAAVRVAPEVFDRLGATVHVIGDSPDGHNINADCGSTSPKALQAAVAEHSADVGVAFDGDADRLIAVDHRGEIIDGDHIIAIGAIDMVRRGVLPNNTVVVTVMTNLGFRRGMAAEGIEVIETQVGDRYVLEALVAGGYGLGGEQSGHVIYPEFATTGDGVLSAVQLLDAVQRSGEPLAELSAKAMTRMPQVLSNVRLAQRRNDLGVVLGPIIEAAEHRLAGRGRVLIRPSGTEPLVRVMVEAESESEAQMEADALVAAVTAALA